MSIQTEQLGGFCGPCKRVATLVTAEVSCPACGLAVCRFCAAAGPTCPRCAMPWAATDDQLRTWRAHAEAIRAMGPRWPYAVSPAYVATLGAALRAGVPRSAIRRLFARIQEELRCRALEEQAARERRAGLPPDWLGEVVM